MELQNIKTDEIRSWEPSKLRETENEIRLEMANIRMDIYSAQASSSGKVTGLKKSLARVLTVSNELAIKAKKGQ
jgi:ribosomal protein L29